MNLIKRTNFQLKKIPLSEILFYLSIVSLLIIITILINIFIPSFGFEVNRTQQDIDKLNNTLLSLSTSYITGYLIYIITILIPYKKRKALYLLFIKDIILQYYYSVIMLYNQFRPDEIGAEITKFNNENKSFIIFFMNNLWENSNMSYVDVLKSQREEFIKNINIHIEYLTEEQLKLIRIIKISPILKQLEMHEFLFLKDKRLLLKSDKLLITKNEYLKAYVDMIIELKNTIRN